MAKDKSPKSKKAPTEVTVVPEAAAKRPRRGGGGKDKPLPVAKPSVLDITEPSAELKKKGKGEEDADEEEQQLREQQRQEEVREGNSGYTFMPNAPNPAGVNFTNFQFSAGGAHAVANQGDMQLYMMQAQLQIAQQQQEMLQLKLQMQEQTHLAFVAARAGESSGKMKGRGKKASQRRAEEGEAFNYNDDSPEDVKSQLATYVKPSELPHSHPHLHPPPHPPPTPLLRCLTSCCSQEGILEALREALWREGEEGRHR
jgi:hypothetical protein